MNEEEDRLDHPSWYCDQILCRKDAERMRLQADQDAEYFTKLRRGKFQICVGSSDVATVCGVSSTTLPATLWTLLLYPDLIYHPESISDPPGQISLLQTADVGPHSLFETEKPLIDAQSTVVYSLPEPSAAMSHGHRFEPVARAIYECLTGHRVWAGGMWRIRFPQVESWPRATAEAPWELLGCSPDGCVLHDPSELSFPPSGLSEKELSNPGAMGGFELLRHAVEFKTPIYKLYSQVPDYYISQVQYQAWALRVPFVDFCAVLIQSKNFDARPSSIYSRLEDVSQYELKELMIVRVYRDERYIEWMTDHLSRFCRCLWFHKAPDWKKPINLLPKVRTSLIVRANFTTGETEYGSPETLQELPYCSSLSQLRANWTALLARKSSFIIDTCNCSVPFW